MATTFNKIYRKVANNGNSNDYQLVSMVGADGIPVDIMKGASASSNGMGGLMPNYSGHDGALLRGDGSYRILSVYTNPNSSSGLELYTKSDKSDKIVLPVLNEYTIRNNSLTNSDKALIGYEANDVLQKLPNGYELSYDRAKMVYHVWGLDDTNYRNKNEYNNMLTETDANSGGSSKILKLNFVNNYYTQSNPFFYPFAELNDDGSGYKRTDIRTVKSEGRDVYPLSPYVHNTYNGMNVCGIKFNLDGLYGIYIRYWYRSHANHRRVSINPYFNGKEHPCYRGSLTTLIPARELISKLFFHNFKKGETFDITAFPVDTCSSTNFVQMGIADVMIYAIKWHGQVSLVEK